MIRAMICILFIFYSGLCYGQENYLEKPAKFITKFPFKQFSGGVILVQARFDTIAQPLNFILDTGSGAISLDSSTTAEFNIAHVPSGKVCYEHCGLQASYYAQHKSLVFPGLTVDSLDFFINDYDILSSVYGEKIDGIIGYSFFSRYIVKINFDSLLIEVYRPGSISYPSSGVLIASSFYRITYSAINHKRCPNHTCKFLH